MERKKIGRQLKLAEKWAIDVEMYNQHPEYSAGAKPMSPICKKCIYYIRSNAHHCNAYVNEEKPHYVYAKECPRFEPVEKLSIVAKNTYEEKFLGAFFGFILGDVMGVPVEFSTRHERSTDPVREIRAYGTYHQPYGTWSDDTSLTLCLIDTLIDGYRLETLANYFVKFLDEGYNTPKQKVFDIGIATKESILNIKENIPLIECGGYNEYSNGNGSLMRILPLVFSLANTGFRKKISMITEVSSITHRHKRSILACIFYVEFGINLLLGLDKMTSYENTISFVVENCKDEFLDEFHNFNRILSKELLDLSNDFIKSSGYVIDSLEASLWCFMNTENYTDAVFNAINLGGDTDTIGAITGSLAGLHYGIDNIPNNRIQYIEKKNDIYMSLCKLLNKLD